MRLRLLTAFAAALAVLLLVATGAAAAERSRRRELFRATVGQAVERIDFQRPAI